MLGRPKSGSITLADKNLFFFKAFLTNSDYFITYSCLTNECGKIFPFLALTFAYFYVKDT